MTATAVDGRIRISGGGLTADLLPFGARLAALWVPDARGRMADVVLGFDDADGYRRSDAFMGAVCGRCANRIADGAFTLDGKRYVLARNDPPNHLHGGPVGFDRRLWEVEAVAADAVTFRYRSDDGEEGYPGTMDAVVSYALADATLRVTMRATADRATIVNLAQHSYWNLDGQGSGDILGHTLRIDAGRYTPVDATLIPTGELAAVAGTPFDLRAPVPLGRAMAGVPGGFDHNWALDGPGARIRLISPASGRGLEIITTAPGVQVYAGGKLSDAVPGKNGARYHPFAGVALETQAFPDSANRPYFPSVRLDPGQTYAHDMAVRFFVEPRD